MSELGCEGRRTFSVEVGQWVMEVGGRGASDRGAVADRSSVLGALVFVGFA